MKMLFDVTELSYYNTNSVNKSGCFYVALNLLEEFVRLGVDVTLYCDFKRYYIFKEIERFKNIRLLPENSKINKLVGKIIYYTNEVPLILRYMFIVLSRLYDRYLYRINDKNIAQLNDFDVYFSPFTPPSKEIQQSKLFKFRMLHDAIPMVENKGTMSPKDWYYKIYSTINSKDFYLTNSEFTKNDILKYFPFIDKTHIKTTLLGADKSFISSAEQSPINCKYIFSLCTLGKRKNLDFAIRNFYKFIEMNNITDLKLVLGGSIWNKYKPILTKLLEKYDKSKIILTGYIDKSELAKYYSNALCFVYPSLYEGFGLPVLEAMKCGCPVITSNTTSLPEVIGDAGIQIDPTSDDDMLEAYRRMYFDKDFRDACIEKGLERAKKFSWEKCANEILDFIKDNI